MNESSTSLRITRGSPLHVNVVDILPSFSMGLTQKFEVNVGSLGKSKQLIQEQTMEFFLLISCQYTKNIKLSIVYSIFHVSNCI